MAGLVVLLVRVFWGCQQAGKAAAWFGDLAGLVVFANILPEQLHVLVVWLAEFCCFLGIWLADCLAWMFGLLRFFFFFC